MKPGPIRMDRQAFKPVEGEWDVFGGGELDWSWSWSWSWSTHTPAYMAKRILTTFLQA